MNSRPSHGIRASVIMSLMVVLFMIVPAPRVDPGGGSAASGANERQCGILSGDHHPCYPAASRHDLHAGRTYGGSECSTTYNRVDEGTRTVTLHYEFEAPSAVPESVSMNPEQVLFNNARAPSSTPVIQVRGEDPEGHDIHYEIEIGTSPGEADLLYLVTPETYPSGVSQQFTYPGAPHAPALVDGTTYYWRVRARAPAGSNLSGPWSDTWSFTKASTGPVSWYQGTEDQLAATYRGGLLTGVVQNPSFEEGDLDHWVRHNTASYGNSGRVSSGVTHGEYACRTRITGDGGSVGSYEHRRQSIDLTGVDFLAFDVNLDGPSSGMFTSNRVKAHVQIDGTTVWESDYLNGGRSPDPRGQHHDIIIDVSDYVGVRELALGLFIANSGMFTSTRTAIYDNIRTFGSEFYELSEEIDLASFRNATRWNDVSWGVGTFVSNSLRVEYNDGTGWRQVPDGSLPGNGAGFMFGPVDISTLDPATHRRIRLNITYQHDEMLEMVNWHRGDRAWLTSWTVRAQWPEPPGIPRNLEAMGGDGVVYLSWDPPLNDGGSNITSYRIYRRVDDPEYSLLTSLPPESLEFSDTNVSNGILYNYRISAVSAVGEGELSSPVHATPDEEPAPPSAPRNLQAAAGSGVVDLSWSAPTTTGSHPLTEYTVYRWTGANDPAVLAVVSEGTTHSDTDVVNGITYHYTVSASNEVGEGPVSGSVEATPRSLPSAPLLLRAFPGNAQVNLAWNPPASDGGSNITAYRIYRGVSSGNLSQLTSLDGDQLGYRDAGLENNRTYYYQVSAVSSAGEGPRSDEVSATPSFTAPESPSAPTNLMGSAGADRIELSWGAPETDGGSPLIAYHIYRNGTEGRYASVSPNQRTYGDTRVAPGVEYTYQVSAENEVGEGPRSGPVGVVSGTPSAPLNLLAVPGDGYVDISWNPPTNQGGSHVLSYRLYRDTGSTAHTMISGSETSYRDGSVENGQTYTYWISAVNAMGEGPVSETVNATPMGRPSAPRELEATAGPGYIALSWNASEGDGGATITHYNVYRGEFPDNLSMAIAVTTALDHTDEDVRAGRTYFYVVSAVNEVGEGPRSNVVSTEPLQAVEPVTVPTAPRNLMARAGDGFVNLSWLPPDDDGGSDITFYNIYRYGSEEFHARVYTSADASMIWYNDTGLANNVTYIYNVSAINGAGEGPTTDDIGATPRAPETVPENGEYPEEPPESPDETGVDLGGFMIPILVVVALLLIALGVFVFLKRRKHVTCANCGEVIVVERGDSEDCPECGLSLYKKRRSRGRGRSGRSRKKDRGESVASGKMGKPLCPGCGAPYDPMDTICFSCYNDLPHQPGFSGPVPPIPRDLMPAEPAPNEEKKGGEKSPDEIFWDEEEKKE